MCRDGKNPENLGLGSGTGIEDWQGIISLVLDCRTWKTGITASTSERFEQIK